MHENPRAARDQGGWLVSAAGLDAAQVPVLCAVRGWVRLNEDWTITAIA